MGTVSRIKLEDPMIDAFGLWWPRASTRKLLELSRSLSEPQASRPIKRIKGAPCASISRIFPISSRLLPSFSATHLLLRLLDCVNNHSDRTPCLDAHLPPVVAVLAASATLQVASAGPWLSPPSVAFASVSLLSSALRVPDEIVWTLSRNSAIRYVRLFSGVFLLLEVSDG